MSNTSLTGTTGTAGSSLGAGGGTSTAGLADWASPYITNYLGKAQALGEMPYQTYGGPLTAGPSELQTKAFQGLGNLTIGNRGTYTPVGGSFTDQYSYPSGTGGSGGSGGGGMGMAPAPMGAGGQGRPAMGGFNQGPKTEDDWNRFSSMAFFAPGTDMEKAKADFMRGGGTGASAVGVDGGSGAGFAQPRSVAEQYMNPYMQNVVDVQTQQAKRQADIAAQTQQAQAARSGAFGGGRDAIMRSQGNAELMRNLADIQATGSQKAFEQAMAQYNTEQGRNIQEAQFGADFGLKGLAAEQGVIDQMAKLGGTQRDIDQQGITADFEEFNRQREYPYKQLQFQRDMISGLPTGSVTNTPAQLSGIAQLISSVGGIDKLLQSTGQGDLASLLNKLGLNFGDGEPV